MFSWLSPWPMILLFCFDIFVQNILFKIKETDLSVFLEIQKLPISIMSHLSKCPTYRNIPYPTCSTYPTNSTWPTYLAYLTQPTCPTSKIQPTNTKCPTRSYPTCPIPTTCPVYIMSSCPNCPSYSLRHYARFTMSHQGNR